MITKVEDQRNKCIYYWCFF